MAFADPTKVAKTGAKYRWVEVRQPGTESPNFAGR